MDPTQAVATMPTSVTIPPILMPTPSFEVKNSEFPDSLPDHTQLPESDGTFVKNFQERPQADLLTNSILPVINQLHPDEQFAIGQDCGIYWQSTQPPQNGAEAPDWFYVPNVPPLLNNKIRRSYVMWKEHIPPLIALEFVSGNGSEERDRTPYKGKFWVYENAIHIDYYGIYEVTKAKVELYERVRGKYQLMQPNARGHYPIIPLGVELGIWRGKYENAELPWMRWWDLKGNLLPTSDERALFEAKRATQATSLAEQLAAQLRAAGIEPNLETDM